MLNPDQDVTQIHRTRDMIVVRNIHAVFLIHMVNGRIFFEAELEENL